MQHTLLTLALLLPFIAFAQDYTGAYRIGGKDCSAVVPGNCSISFDKNPITAGETTNLRWAATLGPVYWGCYDSYWNVTMSVGQFGNVGSWANTDFFRLDNPDNYGATTKTGVIPVSPSQTTAYNGTLSQSKAAHGIYNCSGTLTVSPPASTPTNDTEPDPLSCSITFSQNPIDADESTTINWSSVGAKLFYIENVGYVGGSGSATVQPGETTDFSGYVKDKDGTGTTTTGTAGSQTFTSSGTFSVPEHYGTLTVEVWGAGGGGSAAGCLYTSCPGSNGGDSSFGSLVAHGGKGGNWGPAGFTGGSGGSTSGGDVNTSGGAGASGSTPPSAGGGGGRGANGGSGGAGGAFFNGPGTAGSTPGGGGGGGGSPGPYSWATVSGSGGGGGGYAKKVYSSGSLNGSVSVAVGTGGAGATFAIPSSGGDTNIGGKGANGQVKISWTAGTTQAGEGYTAYCPAVLSVNGDTDDDGGDCPTGYTSQAGACVFDQCPIGYTWQNGACIFDECPVGYVRQGNACIYSACPSGYTLVGTQCIANTPPTCTSGPYCSSSGNLVDGCTGALIQACEWGCFSGRCNPIPAPNATLQAIPLVVHRGNSTQVSWSAQNVTSCTVSSPFDSWTGTSGSKTSSPIQGQTNFTLSCIGYAGANPASITKTVQVNLVPIESEPR